MTYQKQIEFYEFYKQYLLLRTLARQEQSQMTAESASSSSSPLQSDSSSYFGEDCSFESNKEGIEVDCYDCGSGFFSFVDRDERY